MVYERPPSGVTNDISVYLFSVWYPNIYFWTLSVYNLSVLFLLQSLKIFYKKLAIRIVLQQLYIVSLFCLWNLLKYCLSVFVLH